MAGVYGQKNFKHKSAYYLEKKQGVQDFAGSSFLYLWYSYIVRVRSDGVTEKQFLTTDDMIFKLRQGGRLILQIEEDVTINKGIIEAQLVEADSTYIKQKNNDYSFFTTDSDRGLYMPKEIPNTRIVRLLSRQQLDLDTILDEQGQSINLLDNNDIYFFSENNIIPNLDSTTGGLTSHLTRFKKYASIENLPDGTPPTQIVITGQGQQPDKVKWIQIKRKGMAVGSQVEIIIDSGNPITDVRAQWKLWYGKKIVPTIENNEIYKIVDSINKQTPILGWPRKQDNERYSWQLPWYSEIKYIKGTRKTIVEEISTPYVDKNNNLFDQATMRSSIHKYPDGSQTLGTHVIINNSEGFGIKEFTPMTNVLKNAWISGISPGDYATMDLSAYNTLGAGNQIHDDDRGFFHKNMGWGFSGNIEYQNHDSGKFGVAVERAPFNQNGLSAVFTSQPNISAFKLTYPYQIDSNGTEISSRNYMNQISLYIFDVLVLYGEFITAIANWGQCKLDFSDSHFNDYVWDRSSIDENGEYPNKEDATSANTIGLLVENLINGKSTQIGGISYKTDITNSDNLTLKTLNENNWSESGEQWNNSIQNEYLVLIPDNLLGFYEKTNKFPNLVSGGIITYQSGYQVKARTIVAGIPFTSWPAGNLKLPIKSSVINNRITHEFLLGNNSIYKEDIILLELKTKVGIDQAKGIRFKEMNIIAHYHGQYEIILLDNEMKLCVDTHGKTIGPIKKLTTSFVLTQYDIVNDKTSWVGSGTTSPKQDNE